MNQIVTEPTGNGTVRVVVDFEYKDVFIKAGFESDGASIPRILWSFYPPFFPNYLTASMVHDFLCKAEKYAKADAYFDEILRVSNVSTTTRISLVAGVKCWHKIAYRKDNKPRIWLQTIHKLKGFR